MVVVGAADPVGLQRLVRGADGAGRPRPDGRAARGGHQGPGHRGRQPARSRPYAARCRATPGCRTPTSCRGTRPPATPHCWPGGCSVERDRELGAAPGAGGARRCVARRARPGRGTLTPCASTCPPPSPSSADPTGLGPRVVHAVTPALRAALPDEDEEGLEFSAQLLAADDCLDLLAESSAVARRVVVAADVPQDAVAAARRRRPGAQRGAPAGPGDLAGRGVRTRRRARRRGRRDGCRSPATRTAGERLVERDLLWYDVTELAALAAGLG